MTQQPQQPQQPQILKRGDGETLRALGSEITFLCQVADTWSLMHLSAPLHIGPPPHAHDFAEAYYILSGSLELNLGGERLVLEAGDFVHVPGGVFHGFKGASETPAQLLIFQSPADAGEFFRAVAKEVTNIPADLPRVPEIGARYGIRFAPSTCHTPTESA
jgi:mannose-6-phosphate isomerase-like protein (cupin superfamily)